MASRGALRATDPVVGKGILKNAVIKLGVVKEDPSKARTRELNKIAGGRDLSVGYIKLLRDQTLAGRGASRSFRIEADDDVFATGSRVRMVRKLRKKENWLMWKYLFHDLNRSIGAFFSSFAPSHFFKPRQNHHNYEEELAKYLQRVEMQKDAPPPLTCVR